MKFTKMVISLAVVSTISAQAQTGTTEAVESQPTQGVVILNSNTNSNSNAAISSQAQVQEQPATVVEAAPVSESKAEAMRKARKGAELKTEETIVEKLEESRLKEEQERANRLFGNKLEAPLSTTPAQEAPVVVAPVETKATQVTIEKVEIVQPAAPAVEVKEEVAPAAQSKVALEEVEEAPVSSSQFYVGALLGGLDYAASNVKENFGLGVVVGTILDNRWALEGSFVFSNHYLDTFWTAPLYKEVDQYDFSLAAKYYVLSGKLKPYIGGSASYIYRQFQDRIAQNNGFFNPNVTIPDNTTDSHAVNLGLMAGVDFLLNDRVLLGAGIEHSTNVMNKNELNYAQYGLPADSKDLEEIDFTTLKVYGKLTF